MILTIIGARYLRALRHNQGILTCQHPLPGESFLVTSLKQWCQRERYLLLWLPFPLVAYLEGTWCSHWAIGAVTVCAFVLLSLLNGCDGKWERPFTQCVVEPAILITASPGSSTASPHHPESNYTADKSMRTNSDAKHSPTYPGVPHAVDMTSPLPSILDSPKSLIIILDSSSWL